MKVSFYILLSISVIFSVQSFNSNMFYRLCKDIRANEVKQGMIPRTKFSFSPVKVLSSDTEDSLIAEKSIKLSPSAQSEQDSVKLREDLFRTLGWITAGRYYLHLHLLASITSFIFLAFSFASVLGYFQGFDAAVEFCAGYLLEQCLSIDNLFVFLVLFEYFKVTDKVLKERVLGYGLWGAVIFRGIFIALGSFAVDQAKQVTQQEHWKKNT